jgi:hypothetical protein
VAIYRLIANGTFGPEEIEAMTAAYEAALVDLGQVDRDDPITEIVATVSIQAKINQRSLVGRRHRFNFFRPNDPIMEIVATVRPPIGEPLASHRQHHQYGRARP